MKANTNRQALRRVYGHSQGYFAKAKAEEDPWRRDYYISMFQLSAKLMNNLEEEPDAPFGGRKSAVPCSTSGCSKYSWEDAYAVWKAQQSGRELEVRCLECRSKADYTIPPKPVPWTEEETESVVVANLERLVVLDRELFELDWATPQIAALHTLGRLDVMVHSWESTLVSLRRDLGDRFDERVSAARRAAGVDVFLADEYVPAGWKDDYGPRELPEPEPEVAPEEEAEADEDEPPESDEECYDEDDQSPEEEPPPEETFLF